MNKEKIHPLAQLSRAFGYANTQDFLLGECNDCVVPSICTVCHEIGEGEPDMRNGYCHACGGPFLKSALVLARVI